MNRTGWRPALIGAVAGALLTGVVMLLVAAPLALAHRQDLPLEQAYGNLTVSLAARFGAASATNPVAGNQRAISSGRDAYTGSCASCHGDKGDGKGIFGTATYPPATDLTTENAREKSDGELFWIVKHGLSFTAMPGYESQYKDEDIWALVSYVRSLQNGQTSAVIIPSPTMAQLDVADPAGTATQRGAAVYFAQGCQSCHGAVGNAPANLALRGRGETGAIRNGRPGMPAYSSSLISDANLADLEAYMGTFNDQRQGRPPGGGGDD